MILTLLSFDEVVSVEKSLSDVEVVDDVFEDVDHQFQRSLQNDAVEIFLENQALIDFFLERQAVAAEGDTNWWVRIERKYIPWFSQLMRIGQIGETNRMAKS